MEPSFMLYEQAPDLLNNTMNLKKQAIEDDNISALQDMHAEVTFDDLLVAVGKSKNRDAFIRVFEHFAPRVKSFLMKGGMTAELADELAQETMLTVWQKADVYDPQQSAASTWIFTIARNKRIDALRKAGRPQAELSDPMMVSDLIAPDELTCMNEQRERLNKALKELPEEQAALIRKSFLEEKPHTDIAEETNIPLGTVKSRIRLALEKLRYHMGDKEGNGDE